MRIEGNLTGTPEALRAVKGMGEETTRRFGDRFLAAIREWQDCQEAVLGKGSDDTGDPDIAINETRSTFSRWQFVGTALRGSGRAPI